MKKLLPFLLSAFCFQLYGVNWYVRDGASGSGTTWADAYDQLTSAETSAARGDTIYVADGAYTGGTFNTTASGTTVITIKKATVADHGTSTGWSDAYGDGQATYSSQLNFTSRYWVFDGVTGGGPNSWKTGFGFKVTETGSTPVIYCNGSVSGNVTIRHVEIQGAGDNGTAGGTGNDGVNSSDHNSPVTVSYCWIHDLGRCVFFHGAGPLTIEYCLTGKHESTSGEHSEVVVMRTDATFTFRWSVLTHMEGTGGFICGNDTPANGLTTAEIYGNIFYNLDGTTWAGGNNGFIASFTLDAFMRNWRVYNNDFINFPDSVDGYGVTGESPSGNLSKNNYYYSMINTGVGMGWTQTHGHFQDSGSADGSSGTTGSGDPFVSLTITSSDFGKLSANTTAGTDLGSPYNVDMYGTTRSTWTRGAIEYAAAGPDVTAPTVSSATINAAGTLLTVVFSEAVVNSTGFTITPSGGAATLSSPGGSGTATRTWTISRPILSSETVTRSYTAGNIADGSANALGNFSAQSVVNNSTYTANPPEVTSGNAVGVRDSPFSYQIAGDNTPTQFGVVSNLPTGLSVNGSSGIISGVPTVLQTNMVGLAITNGFGFDIEAVEIRIIPPATNIFFGNTNDGGSLDTISANSINGFRWYATNAIVCNTLYAKVAALTGHEKMALYTDSSSLPNILLGDTVERTNPTNGWNSFALNSPVTLTNGNWYWIFIWSDAATSVYYSAGSVTFRYGTLTYGSWPSPITLADAGSPIAYSMYAAGTPPGGQAPTDTTPPTISEFVIPSTSATALVPITALTVTDTPATPTGTTTYYVATNGSSTNNGLSTSTPWPLQYALANAGASNTVILLDGLYTGPFRLDGPDYLTVRALNRWKAVITGSTNTGIMANGYTGEGGIYVSEYITFDGLCVSNNAGDGMAISKNCTIRNCWIVNNVTQGINATSTSASNNIFENNLIELNGGGWGGGGVPPNHGLYVSGQNNIIRNNVVRRNAGWGIHVYGEGVTQNNVLVYNNLTYGHTNAYGVVIWGAWGEDGSFPGTNYCFGNTIIDGLDLSYGTACVTNNIILPSVYDTSHPIHASDARPPTIRNDYNISTATFTVDGVTQGAHDIVTNYVGFVNTNSGLYWLKSDSPARGRAKTTTFGPVDFFGNAQSSVGDIGAFQYSTALAADTRVLYPASSTFSAANYWPPNVSYYISETGTTPSVGAAGWTLTAPTTVTFSGDGARTAYLWAKDSAGNISARAEDSVTITYPVNPSVPSVSALSATAPP